MRTALVRIAAATLLVVAAGCRDATAPDVRSRFSASFSGAVNQTVVGEAGATVGTASLSGTEGTYYSVLMTESPRDDFTRVVGLGRIGTVAEPGTYAVGDSFSPNVTDTFYANSYTRATAGTAAVYRATGGTLTIASRTSTRITGSFDLTMRLYHDDPAATTLHVVGTFDAPVTPAVVVNDRAGQAPTLQ